MIFTFKNWRKLVFTSLSILIGLTVIYSGLWFVIGLQMKNSISNWATKQSLQGWKAEHQKIDMSGFPWQWRFKIKRPILSRASGDIQFHWAGPYIQINVRPWDIKNIKFQTSGQHKVAYTRPNESSSIKLGIEAGQGELKFDKNGKLTHLSFAMLDTVAKITSAQPHRFKRLNVRLSLNQMYAPTEKPHQVSTASLQAELLGLTLPNSFKSDLGRTINRVALSAKVLGTNRGNTLKQTFSSWASSGGSLDLKNFEIHWGKFFAKANGTFTLDAGLQPIAALSGTIKGYNLALKAMIDAGLVKPNLGMVARFALRGIPSVFGTQKEDQIRLSLSIQDGYLYVGRIRLIKLPEVIWN